MAQTESRQMGLVARLTRALDAFLRRLYGIYAFSEDPACILRLSLSRARVDVTLADGVRLERGDPVAIMHFWNERLPPMSPEGVDLRWAREMYSHFRPSLRLLARHLAENPELAEVRAVGGEAAFIHTSNLPAARSLLTRLGLEIHPSPRGTGLGGRLSRYLENVYTWLLIRAFNPASQRGRSPADLERYWLWMSRETLMARYGDAENVRQI